MRSRLYRQLFISLILCLCALQSQRVMAVACADIFTNGIQAHAANGNIKLDYHTSITGGSATLTAKTLTDNSSWAACSGSSCVVTGTAALTSTPVFLTGSGANGAVNVGYQGTASITSGNYTTVDVGQQATLTFSSAGGNYKTGTMITRLKSTVEFQSGDYWINGNLTIGQEAQLRRIATAGTTRIFVNGNVIFDYKATTSGFASNQLLIYATGSITADNETTLSAYLYAGGNISLDYRVLINGAVSGANFIGTGNEVTINYQGSNLSSADFSPFCTSVAPPVICPAGISSGITGKYYNNRLLTEPSTASRSDAPIDFNWGGAAPGPNGITADNFSTKWSGYVRATQSGNYRFQTVSDDGVRLYVNGTLVINRWTDHSATTDTTVDIPLVAGHAYTIVLEYYENGGDATIRLQWLLPGASSYVAIPGGPTPTLGAGLYECVPVAKPPVSSCSNSLSAGITGNYFNNPTLTTPVTATRLDGPINFDWGTGVPGPVGVNDNNFSVSWNGYIYVTQTGVHRFQTNSDDGVRLTVNGDLLIDQWNVHSATVHTSAAVNLEAGKAYPIKLEFYENAGFAVMQLRWQIPGGTSYSAIPIGVNATPVTSAGLYQCNAVAGYAITHSTTGITCAGEVITVTALDSSGSVITPLNGTTVTLDTSSAVSEWFDSDTFIFNGAQNFFTKILKQPIPATVNIDAIDNNGVSGTNNPDIAFSNAALKFSDIPTQVAGVTDNNPTLKAIKTDPVTGVCVPQLSGNKTARIAFSCINPNTCRSGQQLTLNGLAAGANDAGPPANYNTVTLNFNASGIASIPLNYTDVGQVQLHAQVDLPDSANGPAVILVGSSNPFVVKPHTLAVSAVQRTDGTTNPAGTNEPGVAKQFVAAGQQFRVFVEARNAQGNRTPNFGKELVPEKNNLKVRANTVVHPVGGTLTDLTLTGTLAATTPDGTFVNNDVRWNQVGSISILPYFDDANGATTDDGDYLGGGTIPNFISSGTVGRFFPDHFALAGSTLANSCGSFSYMGQPLTLNYTLQARGIAGDTLANYGPNYGPMPSITYVAENADAGINLARFSDGITKTWGSGALTVDSLLAVFSRLSPNGALDGPYSNLQVGLQLTDNFDSRVLQNLDMNATTVGVCVSPNCTAKRLGGSLDMRYGRLRLDDAFGPETAALPVNFSTEYWAGTHFAQHSDDSCTKILRSAIRYPAGNILMPANLTIALNGGSTTGTYGSISATEINFTGGDARHFFTAPSGHATGNFPVEVDLTSYPWLRFDWNQDGAYDDVNLPTARFGFGSYRGHDRVIYWRERFN